MDYGNSVCLFVCLCVYVCVCVCVCVVGWLGGCVFPACRYAHVFICYWMLNMFLIWTHVDMFKCLYACMNVYSCCV